ncbi:restriction endonuclease subunit S [Algoriphagus taiwanensis]|uniref:Type I restriction modification DNA specificity domain-containing protein n=1 Tax=Algoriphagus taiwanensis TaxID=1445656 RepID=A0ABQ6Q2Y8_9BACT|nr:hypothetical protein Ataiwa_27000 [Algoriphagus taiwanensis]
MSEWINTEYGKIASNLQNSTLKEICVSKDGIQTGPFGSQLHKEDYVINGTPIITVEHLDSGFINGDNAPRVSNEDLKRLIKYTLKEGDIVFSRVGSVDRRSLVRKKEEGWMFSGRCLRVRANKSKIDPQYLSYFFGTESFKNHIRSIAVGATMPSINTKILSDVNIFYPPLPEQKAIAHILGSLDEKIELNRQMNQTLETMAQALFKSWFVDFDPVLDNAIAQDNEIPEELQRKAAKRKKVPTDKKLLHTNPSLAAQFPASFVFNETLGKWIPEGWTNEQVELVLNRLKVSIRYKKEDLSPFGNTPVYEQGANILMGYHNGKPDIIATSDDPAFIFGDHTCVMKLGMKPFSISANVIALKGKVRNTIWTYFSLLGVQSFEEYRRHWMELAAKQIPIAPKNVCNAFESMVKDLILKQVEIQNEIETLTQLRDRLLPELISGRVRIC